MGRDNRRETVQYVIIIHKSVNLLCSSVTLSNTAEAKDVFGRIHPGLEIGGMRGA